MLLINNFNESLTLGIFPENKNLAKVTPILKSGRNELLTNRSISLLRVSLKYWKE